MDSTYTSNARLVALLTLLALSVGVTAMPVTSPSQEPVTGTDNYIYPCSGHRPANVAPSVPDLTSGSDDMTGELLYLIQETEKLVNYTHTVWRDMNASRTLVIPLSEEDRRLLATIPPSDGSEAATVHVLFPRLYRQLAALFNDMVVVQLHEEHTIGGHFHHKVANISNIITNLMCKVEIVMSANNVEVVRQRNDTSQINSQESIYRAMHINFHAVRNLFEMLKDVKISFEAVLQVQ